jgi:hypothetical protein
VKLPLEPVAVDGVVGGDTEHAIQEAGAGYIALEEWHNEVEVEVEDSAPKVLHIIGTAKLLNTHHVEGEGQSCSGGEVADSWQEDQIVVVQHWVRDNGECSAGQGTNLRQT